MQKKEYDCVGVDVSKGTLDIALYRGEVDWKGGHIKVYNNGSAEISGAFV